MSGASFTRRFLFNPGNAVLLNIESINILDLTPPASIAGIASGTVLITGEFEDGPYNSPIQVNGANDLLNQLGGFGYTYGGVSGQYPCAVARYADGAVFPEYWNGNSMIQMNGNQFGALVCCRVNTSVGNVTLTPCAYITGGTSFRYLLSAGQVLGLDVGAGPQTATFNATAAVTTSTSQTFPDGFVGGETLTLGYDQASNFVVTFLPGDTTQAKVIARVNQYAGFSFAASSSGTVMTLTGLALGNQAQVRVIGASASGVLTALGLSVGTSFGTGNVGNIAAVTPAEVTSVVQTAISNTRVELDQNGALRISNSLGTLTSWVNVTSATTATGLGFTIGQMGVALGLAGVLSTAGTYTILTSGTFTMLIDPNNPQGVNGGLPFTVTLAGGESQAQTITKINTAAGATVAYADSTTQIAIIGKTPGGLVQFVSASAPAVVTQMGFTFGTTVGAGYPQGNIPAGTVVQNSGATAVYVTTQTVTFGAQGATIAGVAATLLGPWSVPVRFAVDNEVGGSQLGGAITVIPTPPLIVSLNVVNPAGLSAALTDTQIDAAYVNALAATTSNNTVAGQVNISFSARQSNTVRSALKNNALTASANGCYGRIACIRPPLGTTEANAFNNGAAPGVGATRDQRVIYCWPQRSTFVPIIGQLGTAGGAGFTATGNVDAGADGLMASMLSQLPPEENPGQETSFTGGTIGLESSPNAQGLQIGDYIAGKAAGVAMLRVDSNGIVIFQSGITSVNPLVYPSLVRISRRRMADFIQDSIALIASSYGKKLNTAARRNALTGEIRSFLDQLLSLNNPGSQRIAGYVVDPVSGNTPTTLGMGMFVIIVAVQTLSSLDSIVIQTTIGDQVDVSEQLPAAA
jgi:hypothetical protein